MLQSVSNFIITCLCGNRKKIRGEEIEVGRRYPIEDSNKYKKCKNYSPKSSKSTSKM